MPLCRRYYKIDIVNISNTGLEPNSLRKVIKIFSLNKNSLEWVVNSKTLSHRIKKDERLTPEETAKVIRVTKIYVLADEVFGNTEKAHSWLNKPRKVFDNQPATKMMKSEHGAQIIEDELKQIDSGFLREVMAY